MRCQDKWLILDKRGSSFWTEQEKTVGQRILTPTRDPVAKCQILQSQTALHHKHHEQNSRHSTTIEGFRKDCQKATSAQMPSIIQITCYFWEWYKQCAKDLSLLFNISSSLSSSYEWHIGSRIANWFFCYFLDCFRPRLGSPNHVDNPAFSPGMPPTRKSGTCGVAFASLNFTTGGVQNSHPTGVQNSHPFKLIWHLVKYPYWTKIYCT
jgi:hypothetical protein